MEIKNRIQIIDVLRGLSILSIAVIHFVEQFNLGAWPQSESIVLKTLNNLSFNTIWFFFASKSFGVFAFMFGVSYHIIINNERLKGKNGQLKYLWRMFLLLIIGLIHASLYNGDILTLLAIVGLFIPLFNKCSNKLLIGISLVFLLQLPFIIYAICSSEMQGWNEIAKYTNSMWEGFWEAGTGASLISLLKYNAIEGQIGKIGWWLQQHRVSQILGLALLGIVSARVNFWSNIKIHFKKISFVFVISVITYFVIREVNRVLPYDIFKENGYWYVKSIIESYINILLTFAFITSVILLYFHTKLIGILNYMGSVGRLSLTAYVLQPIVGQWLFYGYGLSFYKIIGQFYCAVLGFIFAILLTVILNLYGKRFRYGPIEYIWRKATNIIKI